jgi:DNA gyrase subunit B
MKEYGTESIKILDGLDTVRKVQSMFIGNQGTEGLYHLVCELVNNSVDEALEKHHYRIHVTMNSQTPS